MNEFNQKRRQQFLNEQYYQTTSQITKESIEIWTKNLPAEGQNELHKRALAALDVAENRYELLSLRYTAGESLLELRDELETVILAYEQYARYERQFHLSDTYPVFAFQEILHFERLMQLLGLCYLLHRTDLIPRIHAFIEGSGYDMEDAVYEEMISHVISDRPYLENWYHQLPYLHLLNASDAEDLTVKTEELEQYVKKWYPAMENASWHGSHTRMTPEGSEYFGYWAFEAGAIAVLYGIDDSGIDHMVYPRHAVDFARSFKQNKDEYMRTGRCEALQKCPRTGYWYTPAKQYSRRRFTDGEVMPDFLNSLWGATIWYWDTNQSE